MSNLLCAVSAAFSLAHVGVASVVMIYGSFFTSSRGVALHSGGPGKVVCCIKMMRLGTMPVLWREGSFLKNSHR